MAAAQELLLGIEQHAAKNGVPCWEDPTLPPLPAGQHVFLASNLHDNEALLPHFSLQLLRLLVAAPQGSCYVSIYESGSGDRTGACPVPLPRIMSPWVHAEPILVHIISFAVQVSKTMCVSLHVWSRRVVGAAAEAAGGVGSAKYRCDRYARRNPAAAALP